MIYHDKILESIVQDFFDTKIIKDGDILLVALSGGMDSMALTDAFIKLKSEIDYSLVALHVHHGIRGTEADRDLQFVKKYCKSMGLKLIIEKVDAINYSKKNKLTLEEAARILRYKAIDDNVKKLQKKNNNVYVLIAHHEKDLVETIVHNIVRGTGIRGAVGIKKISSNVLRPLLDISKKDIEEYVDRYDIPYVSDSTNDDIKYTRNFIRKEIVGRLTQINNKASEHIVEFARQAREISDYIDKESKKAFDDVLIDCKKDNIVLDLKRFRDKDKVLKNGVIKITFDNLIKTLKDITTKNYEDIINLSDKLVGGHLDLPYNIVVDKKKNNLIFTKTKKNVSMSRRKKK